MTEPRSNRGHGAPGQIGGRRPDARTQRVYRQVPSADAPTTHIPAGANVPTQVNPTAWSQFEPAAGSDTRFWPQEGHFPANGYEPYSSAQSDPHEDGLGYASNEARQHRPWFRSPMYLILAAAVAVVAAGGGLAYTLTGSSQVTPPHIAAPTGPQRPQTAAPVPQAPPSLPVQAPAPVPDAPTAGPDVGSGSSPDSGFGSSPGSGFTPAPNNGFSPAPVDSPPVVPQAAPPPPQQLPPNPPPPQQDPNQQPPVNQPPDPNQQPLPNNQQPVPNNQQPLPNNQQPQQNNQPPAPNNNQQPQPNQQPQQNNQPPAPNNQQGPLVPSHFGPPESANDTLCHPKPPPC